ncbi:molybdenum cofactor biosynthesis protein MoaE [Sporocytophaga myxococcoides]|uniref:molybdenum cofactor biosynthesis protein MoaE n=1 Tax=Sporocytophaga myxococcoides TaxID=153721 RepID=UPI0003F569D1|nr:molybdenum cofactor biosynthesis protein MoaE [Sporocytophaga myxococcoides]
MQLITEDQINLITMLSEAHDPKAGAVVLFSGEVRNHSHKRDVDYLFYECYIPMAEKIIKEIIETSYTKFKLHKALCCHRIGKVGISESAVVVITASSHREEAYAANRYIIDRVKHEAPIWKQEFFSDGTYEWGHNCSCFEHQHSH